jgi:beta-phosphoglucomutase-like phosphatase (HAD superfamily)
MNQGHSSFTALDDILSQTRHLLLSFNGPVCPLFANTTSAAITAQLRDVLTRQNAVQPAEIMGSDDWQQILTYAASINPQLAKSVESELTELESASARTAEPTSHLHEMVSACRESGRTLAVVSNASSAVIRSYLTDHSLANAITVIAARTPATLAGGQIEQATSELGTVPAACAYLTALPTDIAAAQRAGTRTIGYAKAADDHDLLASARADTIISNLADLTLRLRARPLPN